MLLKEFIIFPFSSCKTMAIYFYSERNLFNDLIKILPSLYSRLEGPFNNDSLLGVPKMDARSTLSETPEVDNLL